jgi:WD40 repeat protein
MNLELLDPFRRQIPDRIDATLSLPAYAPPPTQPPKGSKKRGRKKKGKEKESDDDDEDSSSKADSSVLTQPDDEISANHVAFNRRGTYVAVGYGNGTVGIFDMLSRTMTAVYKARDEAAAKEGHGITCVSWSRRSRTLVCGSASESRIKLIDTTHPSGPSVCNLDLKGADHGQDDNKNDNVEEEIPAFQKAAIKVLQGNNKPPETSFAKEPPDLLEGPMINSSQLLPIELLEVSEDVQPQPPKKREHVASTYSESKTSSRSHPAIEFDLPLPMASIVQVHPRDITAGFACLNDGSIVAFHVPLNGWTKLFPSAVPPSVKIVPIFKSEDHFVTAAAFDPQGERIYAATDSGHLLGFEVATIFDHLAEGARVLPKIKPNFTIFVPGGSSVWHVQVSRNGRYLVLNSADGAIRLYSTKECWTTPEEVEKPMWVFQDVVTKTKFASCDLSGDAEYVVGLANGADNKYHLYMWNTSTGALMDKLTGASVETYSVAWHPTRSFLAVATSDGLTDVWGPRINWTAFAPDFQALPSNVEYVEREDEFDIDENKTAEEDEEDSQENQDVDVVTIEPVPVFASDSEGEEEVFCFEPTVSSRM